MAVAAALFSRFYQGGLGFIKRTRVGTGDGLGTVRVFPMALFFGEMRETSRRVTTHQQCRSRTSSINHFIRDTFDRQAKGCALKLSPKLPWGSVRSLACLCCGRSLFARSTTPISSLFQYYLQGFAAACEDT